MTVFNVTDMQARTILHPLYIYRNNNLSLLSKQEAWPQSWLSRCWTPACDVWWRYNLSYIVWKWHLASETLLKRAGKIPSSVSHPEAERLIQFPTFTLRDQRKYRQVDGSLPLWDIRSFARRGVNDNLPVCDLVECNFKLTPSPLLLLFCGG